MNPGLTEKIVHHVLANFGVVPASFINPESTQSLLDKSFLLPDRLTFQDSEGTTHSHVYGCQTVAADTKTLKILLTNCLEAEEVSEFCLILHLQDSPTYGLFLVQDPSVGGGVDYSEAMIAVSLDSKNWMPCNTYLQATFLAGVEQIRDLGRGWSKCTSYQDEFQALQSFIKFHTLVHQEEEVNEGQEI